MGLGQDGFEAPEPEIMEAPPEPPELPDEPDAFDPIDGGDAGDVTGAGPVDALTDLLAAEDHTTPPPGAPTGELGDAPPIPGGAGGDGAGQSVIGGPPAPVVDLGGGEDADRPVAPPVPPGIDPNGGGQSPVGNQPGFGAVDGAGDQPGDGAAPPPHLTGDTTTAPPDGGVDEVPLLITPDEPPMPPVGGDTTTEPPGDPTGVQGDPPPVPPTDDNAGGGQSPFGAQPGLGGLDVAEPATLSSEAATQLLAGMVPGMAPEAIEVAVLGAIDDDGKIDVTEIVDLLHAHGAEPHLTTGTTVEELVGGAESVQLIANIDGAAVPLTVDHVDAPSGMLVCRDGGGAQFEGRIEDIDRAWKASGAPVISVPSAAPGAGAPEPPAAGGVEPPPAPPLDALPAAATAESGSGGISALGLGAAALVPVAIGGGIFARRLARRS